MEQFGAFALAHPEKANYGYIHQADFFQVQY